MRLRVAILTGLMAGTLAAPAPALASPPPALQGWSDEAAVIRSFRAVLGRDPSQTELRRYAVLVDDYGWTEQDVRRDLAERSDYRRYSTSRFDVDGMVRRAYLDILDREPDAAGLRSYRDHVIREGWSEWDVREALRRSPEYRSPQRRNASADRIIVRAYRDILRRDPDPEGLAAYRHAILNDGWDEQDVRRALRRSDERAVTRTGVRGRFDAADDIVRRAYRNVLHREPDAAGLRDYGQRVRRDRWTQADVERALLDSEEYRIKHR